MAIARFLTAKPTSMVDKALTHPDEINLIELKNAVSK